MYGKGKVDELGKTEEREETLKDKCTEKVKKKLRTKKYLGQDLLKVDFLAQSKPYFKKLLMKLHKNYPKRIINVENMQKFVKRVI